MSDEAAVLDLPGSPAEGETTQIGVLLAAWGEGRAAALDDLMPLVLGELRRLAQHFFQREPPDHTLQATALVNEVYLHLRGRRQVSWRDRGQFFGYAARTMRRLLVDHARARWADKRGGGARPVSLEGLDAEAPARPLELIALDRALEDLAALDARQARIVELRCFAGLTENEIAALLETSERTVRRDWLTARLWLRQAMQAGR
jgi:RNA polymerase sigma factor (TIGR02999 family)